MSNTSQKHRNFVAEPMYDKPVTDLAGVGEVLGKRLADAGFNKAYHMLGQFLILNKNKYLFQEWMKNICQSNSKQSAECWQCINDWCEEFIDEEFVTSRAPLLPKAIAKAPDGEGCPRCGGYVYAAEQMLARGRGYHRVCFRCNNCSRWLDSTSHCDGPDYEVYCKGFP